VQEVPESCRTGVENKDRKEEVVRQSRNWKDVPIPSLMQKLPKDARGYPIPFVVLYDNEGRPHFTVNDEMKVQECLARKLCAICGSKLENKRYWMAGGPLSAFHPQGRYFDTPVHRQCGEYAMQVCPYLAVPSYNKRIEGKTLDPSKTNVVVTLDPTVMPDRPPLFVMGCTDKITLDFGGNGVRHVIPRRPWKTVQFWQGGVRLDPEEAMPLVEEALATVGLQRHQAAKIKVLR
jgi:hypothetical protein